MLKRLLLGENIKKHRKKMQLTQTQLAEKMFVSTQAISNWERGLTPPDLENLCKLSEFFHVSVDSLLGKDDFLGEKLMIGIDGGGTKPNLYFLQKAERFCINSSFHKVILMISA